MNNAFLCINNNTVGGGRVVDLYHTEEEWNALDDPDRNMYINEAAWEYAEADPVVRPDGVYIGITLGFVNDLEEVYTGLTEKEYNALDAEERHQVLIDAFWEGIDCWVCFTETEDQATTELRGGW